MQHFWGDSKFGQYRKEIADARSKFIKIRLLKNPKSMFCFIAIRFIEYKFWKHPSCSLTDCYETIPKSLIQLAKAGSSDNITVILVYLKEPSEIAKFSWPSADKTQPLENMETTTTTTTDPIVGANETNPFGTYNFESSNQVSWRLYIPIAI